jgi:hypothetical protein
MKFNMKFQNLTRFILERDMGKGAFAMVKLGTH